MIDFYSRYCDCSVVHWFCNPQGERYGAMLRVADSDTFLELFRDVRSFAGGAQPFRHISFQTGDIEALGRRLREAGVNVEIKRGRTDRILQFWCSDPDGNEVEFTQFDAESVYGERQPTEASE